MAGKVILISGVTPGLGKALTGEFIRPGHRVLGCGRTSAAIPMRNSGELRQPECIGVGP